MQSSPDYLVSWFRSVICWLLVRLERANVMAYVKTPVQYLTYKVILSCFFILICKSTGYLPGWSSNPQPVCRLTIRQVWNIPTCVYRSKKGINKMWMTEEGVLWSLQMAHLIRNLFGYVGWSTYVVDDRILKCFLSQL